MLLPKSNNGGYQEQWCPSGVHLGVHSTHVAIFNCKEQQPEIFRPPAEGDLHTEKQARSIKYRLVESYSGLGRFSSFCRSIPECAGVQCPARAIRFAAREPIRQFFTACEIFEQRAVSARQPSCFQSDA